MSIKKRVMEMKTLLSFTSFEKGGPTHFISQPREFNVFPSWPSNRVKEVHPLVASHNFKLRTHQNMHTLDKIKPNSRSFDYTHAQIERNNQRIHAINVSWFIHHYPSIIDWLCTIYNYIDEMANFPLFISTMSLRVMLLHSVNDLVITYVALGCLSPSSYM